MKIKLIMLLSFLLVTPSAGCSSAYWLGTEDVADSITMSKSAFGASVKVQTRKDTAHKLDLDKAEWTGADGSSFSLDGLHSDYNGRATDVIMADSQRALAVGQAQLSQAAYVDSLGRFVESLGAAVKSGLLSYGEARAMALNAGAPSVLSGGGSISLPGGGGVTLNPSNPSPPTTSQPTNPQ